MNNKKNNQQYGYGAPQQSNQQEFPQSFINPQNWPTQQSFGADQSYNYPFYGVPQPPSDNVQPPLPPPSPNQGNQQQGNQQGNSNKNRRGQNRQNFGNRGNKSNNNRGGNHQQQQFHNQNSQGMNQDHGPNHNKRKERSKSWRQREDWEMEGSWQQQQQQPQHSRTPDQPEQRQNLRSQPPNKPPEVAPPLPSATLSKEEIEFDEQFRKWELEFTNWKEANVNHPDREAYRQYEKQFEGVREKLLSRRNEMMKKKLEQQQVAAQPKTAEQLKFESQWQAGPSTETPKPLIVPPASSTKSPFTQSYQEKFDDDDHYDDANYGTHRKSFAFIGGSQIGSNFDDPDGQSQNPFHVNPHQLSIPGLDSFHIREPVPAPITVVQEPPIPVIDLDPDNPSVPPMPVFNSNQPNRAMQDLNEILEEPGRRNRHSHILVIIRGAPGSGKSYIANLIKEKEIKYGNQGSFASLSIDKFVPNGPLGTAAIDKFQNKILFELRDLVGTKKYNFITIEIEGGTLTFYNKYSYVVGPPFKVYVIEIRQTFEACMKYNQHGRSVQEIQSTIDEMRRYPTPFKVPLLDPTSLILNSAPKNTPAGQHSEAPVSILANTTNIMNLLQDKNVLDLVQSQLKPTPATQSPTKAPVQPLMSLPSSSQLQPDNFPAPSQQKNFEPTPGPFFSPNAPDLRHPDAQNFQPSHSGLQSNNQSFNQGGGAHFPKGGNGGFQQSGNANFQQSGNANFQQSGNANFQQGSSANFQQGSSTSFQQGGNGNFQQGASANFQQEGSTSFQQGGNGNFQRNNHNYQPNMSNYPPMNSNFHPNPGYSEDPQAGRSNLNHPSAPADPFDSCPTFTPTKIIDYKHVHMQTLSEQLMEFRVFRVVDYKHKPSAKIREYVKDIDIDKIKEKRKSVALRKKILEYLKSAEKPEDTVSNPKYPKNWEVVRQEERPKSGTKRGKRQTEKIIRVKARKLQETAWMTKGYAAKAVRSDEEMELSDISSDDDFNPTNKHEKSKAEKAAPAIVVPEPPKPELPVQEEPVPVIVQETTIPNFNAFNHAKTSGIHTIWPKQKSSKRPGKILILLRGAPGSGKSHLTGLIKQKETAMGFGIPRIVSINDYLDDEDLTEFDAETLECYMSQMVKFVERTIREGHHTFIIVDAENTDLSFYEKFHQAGSTKDFTVFTIELQQTLEYCLVQNIHNRSQPDIEKAIGDLEKNRIPADHSVLDPKELYEEFGCLVNKKIKGDPVEDNPKNEPLDLDDDSSLEWIDLENSTGQQEKDFAFPIFNANNHSSVTDLETILELPGRCSRPGKVLIILRGPPGVGKTHLSELILQREESMGNAADKVSISIDSYYINPATMVHEFNKADEEKNKASLLSDLKENCQKFKFIVVDAENGSLKDYEQVYKIGVDQGFKCYAIELHLDADTCMSQNVHKRTLKEIEEVLKVINENPIPSDHECLDASYLYINKTLDEDMDTTTEAVPLKPALKLSEGVQIAVKRKVEAPSKLPEFNWHNRDQIQPLRSFLESMWLTARVAIILRGAPGSGKSYLAQLIKRCAYDCGIEQQFKYFSLEDFVYGDTTSEKAMERLMEELAVTMQEVLNKLIVVDADCCEHQTYMSVCDIAKQNKYSWYTVEMIVDDDVCTSDDAIKKNRMLQETPTPSDHNLLDPEHLYEEYKNLLDENESEEDDKETSFGPLKRTTVESKWDDEGDAGGDTVIERLDGTRNKTFERLTMANYLQTEDEWTMRPSQSGKKRVRWADIEEKKEQERMRDIGFIVGQTDWKRMTDTSDGKSALEKTKYIEPRKKT